MHKNKHFVTILLLILIAGFGIHKYYFKNEKQVTESKVAHSNQKLPGSSAKPEIPQKVYTVLQYVTTHHKPMEGYVGGKEFKNREKRLPEMTTENKTIDYQEWDVNPKIFGQNRGVERLITGNDNSAWFTANHYQSFIKIK
jgi:ribonuclease T1